MNWALLSELVQDRLEVMADLDKIKRFGKAIFDVEFYGNIPDANAETHEKEAVHKYIVTLERKPGKTLPEKIDSLKKFLDLISGGKQTSTIIGCINDAGYDEPSSEDDLPRFKIPDAHLKKFEARSYHKEIVKHCQKFYEGKHYTSAVLEASKAYNSEVKKESGLSKDGAELMMAAFSENGTVKINFFRTDSEKNEQKGIMFLSAGLVQAFRNPTAHETVLNWMISEEDCLDILSFISYLFKKLDAACIYS